MVKVPPEGRLGGTLLCINSCWYCLQFSERHGYPSTSTSLPLHIHVLEVNRVAREILKPFTRGCTPKTSGARKGGRKKAAEFAFSTPALPRLSQYLVSGSLITALLTPDLELLAQNR